MTACDSLTCVYCQKKYDKSDAHDFEHYCSAHCEAVAVQVNAQALKDAERDRKDLEDLL